MSSIVVGIDGSERSARALKWALDEGRLRDVPVDVVHVYSPPERGLASELAPLPLGQSFDEPDRTEDERLESANRRAHERINAMVKDASGDGAVRVHVHVEPGRHASEALVARSEGAIMLVLANRGLGAFKGALLGSVSLHCIQHAKCPVVTVPGSF